MAEQRKTESFSHQLQWLFVCSAVEGLSGEAAPLHYTKLLFWFCFFLLWCCAFTEENMYLLCQGLGLFCVAEVLSTSKRI